MKLNGAKDENSHPLDETDPTRGAQEHPPLRTGRHLRTALEGSHPPDDKFSSDIHEAIATLLDEPSEK